MTVKTRSCHGALLVLGMLSMFSAEAACTKTSGVQPFTVPMNMGQVVIPRNAVVGDVIASKSFPIPFSGQLASCTGSGNMIGVMLQGGPIAALSTSASAVYTTNVKGIGIRLSRTYIPGNTTSRWYYPHEVPAVIGSSGIGDVNFAPGNTFTVELIKTAAETGSGVLASGDYTRYYADGDGATNPIMSTRLEGGATTLVTATCSVSAGSVNKVVDLQTVGMDKFSHQGAVIGDRPFNIDIQCNKGDARRVALKWDETYQHASRAAGVLAPVPLSGGATGVAIQLVNEQLRPVTFGDQVQWLGAVADTSYRVPFKARYYQTGQNVTTGPVRAVARFSLNYE